MPEARVRAMIKGYMAELNIPYQEADDGSQVRVLIGSTAVYIRTYNWNRWPVVQFEAPVLVGVHKDAPIGMLPMLNRRVAFAKFGFDADNGVVTVDCELLGEHMDQAEFHNALLAVGTVADEWDDQLQKEFGGELHMPDSDEEDL